MTPIPLHVLTASADTDDTAEKYQDVLFFPPDSNLIEPVMDYVIEDDFDNNIIEERWIRHGFNYSGNGNNAGTVIPLRKHEIQLMMMNI